METRLHDAITYISIFKQGWVSPTWIILEAAPLIGSSARRPTPECFDDDKSCNAGIDRGDVAILNPAPLDGVGQDWIKIAITDVWRVVLANLSDMYLEQEWLEPDLELSEGEEVLLFRRADA